MEVLSPDKASKWVTNSNEAVQIRLVSGANPHGIQSALHKINTTSVGDDSLDQDSEGLESIDLVQFHPVFTYPIYGTQERIFGYKGLHVDINVSAGSLRTQMRVRYSKRVEDMESTSLVKLKSDDVYGPIRKILPDGKGADMEPAASLVRRYGQQHSLTEYIDTLGSIDLISNEEEFARVVAEDTEEFRPMGSKIHEYRLEDSSGSVFEVYENSFSSEKFKQFHSRMQPFILFFIEGGTFIDTDDERWRVYTLFEKWDFEGSTGYSFIGYLTMYRFFHWPDKLRARI
ncbi:histone acetyltransferase 1, partial [Spiromyces aspiralis]